MNGGQSELKNEHGVTKILLVRILPALFMFIGAVYWLAYRQASSEYFAYLISLPAFFTVAIVRTAGKLKFWQWSYSILTAASVWIGFSQLFFLINAHLIAAESSTSLLIEAAMVGLFLGAIIGTLFDILAIDSGIITVFNRAHFKGQGAIRSACSYGPYFFGGFGLFINVLATLGHQNLAAGASAWKLMQWVVGGSILLCLPFAVFLAIIRHKQKKSELRRKSRGESL